MPGFCAKVFHVLANNFRRHRYRLAGLATLLIAAVFLTLLLGSKFNGSLFRMGRGEEDDMEEIQLQPPGSTVSASFRAVPHHVGGALKRVTPPKDQPQTTPSTSRDTPPSPKSKRETTPTTPSSPRIDPPPKTIPSSPSRRKATLSPHNPCDPDTFPKRPPDDLKESVEWQGVSEGATNTYVFSAYFDSRGERRAIVIVALSSDYMGPSVVYACQIWFGKKEKTPEVTPADITTHSETHARK